MKRRVFVVFVVVALLVLAGFFLRERPSPEAYAGYVEADVYLLGFEFPGKILDVRVEEGDEVDEGDTLAVLDTTDLHLERLRLAEQIEAGQQGLIALEHQLALERQTLERYAGMDTGSVPEVQLDAMKTRVRTLEARRAKARHQLNALSVALEGVKHRLSRAVLTAPRKGLVLDVLSREGEAVVPGRPVVRLGALDTVEVIAFLPEPDLPRFQPGDTLWVRGDGMETPRAGRLSWIAPEAEYASGFVQTEESRKDLVFRARIRLPNPDRAFKIGMPVDVFPSRP